MRTLRLLVAVLLLVAVAFAGSHHRHAKRSTIYDLDDDENERIPVVDSTEDEDREEKECEFQQCMFEQLDADHNGKVSRDEIKPLEKAGQHVLGFLGWNTLVLTTNNKHTLDWDLDEFKRLTDLVSPKLFHPELYPPDIPSKLRRQRRHQMRQELEALTSRKTPLRKTHINLTVALAKDLLEEYNTRGEAINLLDGDYDHMVSLEELTYYLRAFAKINDYTVVYRAMMEHQNQWGRLDATGHGSLIPTIRKLARKCGSAFVGKTCIEFSETLLHPYLDWNEEDKLDDYEILELASALFYNEEPGLSRKEVEAARKLKKH